MMSLDEIIIEYTEGKLSNTAEFYSGRGNNLGDLNSDLIEKVYTGVKIEIGDKAAKAFVNMVGEMTTDASATTFLVALRRLARNKWEFTPRIVPSNAGESFAEAIADASRKNGENEASFAVMVGLASVFGGKQRGPLPGDGLAIIGSFLSKHERELDKKIPLYDHRYRDPYL